MMRNPRIASVNPSGRPPPALPPSTTSSSVSATCDWSMSLRTHRIMAVDAASKPSQSSQRPANRQSAVVTAEPISKTWLRDHDARDGGIALDLAPQMRDVHAKIVRRVAVLLGPDRVEDLLMAHGASAVDDERSQDRPFGG